jgi:hypothetical protein
MLFTDVRSRLAPLLSAILLSAVVGSPQSLSAQAAAKKATLEISVGTNNTLVLPRTVFGKEHLMSASRIPQSLAATSTGLSGKIVKFELFHDGVDLYEATDGLVVTKDLPARRILTTFPIVEQDATKVVIDFNRGMRRLYTEIWYGQGRGFNPMSRDESLEIPQSRVFQAEKLDNQLAIRQSVQVRDREAMANVEQRFEVRYFFTPYEAGVYKGKEAPASDLRYSRFFETQARLEESTGRPSPQMARFDLSKPVVFHYSANTPADYVEAVKDGILYWNRAFGTNVVKAEKAPAGVTAPDPRYNIVQWVPWDNAGFAYADILIDPRTGQSEHGQAYMTSVFALSGKARARALLRSMRDLVVDKKKLTADAVGGEAAQGFPWMTANGLCHMQSVEFAHQYAQGLEDLLSNETLTDAGALRASQDYVREVVAHEVGHVLGLRHNFAGSVSMPTPTTSPRRPSWSTRSSSRPCRSGGSSAPARSRCRTTRPPSSGVISGVRSRATRRCSSDPTNWSVPMATCSASTKASSPWWALIRNWPTTSACSPTASSRPSSRPRHRAIRGMPRPSPR